MAENHTIVDIGALERVRDSIHGISTEAVYSNSTGQDILIHYTNSFLSYNLTINESVHLNSSSPIHTTVDIVLISLVAGALSLFTICGNLFVIVAFKLDKQLQITSNCFLLSLAVADLTIGLVSMPLYTLYLLMGYWPLGPILCDLWLSLDYTMSNASVANLLVICFDRYLSVTRPLTYRANRTPRKVGIMISCAWVISALLWTPWIFAWPYIEGERTVPNNECYIQFLRTNTAITIATALAAFYIPVTIMSILYFIIYRETEKRQKRIPMLQGKDYLSESNKSKGSSTDEDTSATVRRGDMSPEYEDLYEFADPHAREPRSCCSRCNCFKLVDHDYEPPDDSSTSDPPASPGAHMSVSNSHNHISFRGNSSRRTSKRFSLGGRSPKPKTNGTMYNFGLALPSREISANKTSPALSPMTPMTDISIVTSPCSNVSVENEIVLNEPDIKRNESNDSMYTIMIKLPHGDLKSPDSKPSIKMYRDHENTFEEQVALMPTIKAELEDSDFDDINELKLNEESSFIKISAPSKLGESADICDSVSSSSESLQPANKSSTRYSFTNKASLPPPCGTPALGRRTRSFDAIKSASQARLALRVVNKVKTQRVRRKRQERRQDRKAAKTLSAILLAFIVTWTPYNIFAIVEAYCEGCINPTLYAFGKYNSFTSSFLLLRVVSVMLLL